MKKSFYFALALTAGLFASCSSDEIAQAPNQVIDDGSPVEIQLGVKSDITVTRGTGTVGADPTSGAVGYGWAGQTFNVYMLDKGKLSTAVQQYGEAYDATANPYVYDNAVFKAPEHGAGNSTAALESGVTAYYPTDGKYDFWAYRADDATDGAADPKLVKVNATSGALEDLDPTTETPDDAKYLVVPFTIDGSQDVMVAEVSPSATSTDVTEEDYYSAKTGRRNIRPNFAFKHLLTRLTFKIKADNIAVSDAADDLPGAGTYGNNYFKGFKVTKITVRSANTGNLIAAYKVGENEVAPTLDQRIIWNTNEADWTTPDVADGGSVILPELLLKSRTEGITTPATGVFQKISGINTRALDGSVEINLSVGTTPLLESTILWSNNTDKSSVTGRPTSISKTAKAWKDAGTTADLYYWDETAAPATDGQLSANTDLTDLIPVVPHWDVDVPGKNEVAVVTANSAAADNAALTTAIAAGKGYVKGTDGDLSLEDWQKTLAVGTDYVYSDGDATAPTITKFDITTAYEAAVAAHVGTNTGEATPIGEALLVAPAPEAGYMVTVYYSHYKAVNATTCALDETGKVSKMIVLKSTGGTADPIAYKRAKQYNITIKLYKDGTAESDTTVEDFGDDTEGSLDNEYSFE